MQGGPKEMEPPREKNLEELARKREKKKTFRPGFFLSSPSLDRERVVVVGCCVFRLLLLPRGRSPRSCPGYQGEEKEASVAKTRGGGGREKEKGRTLLLYPSLLHQGR